MSSIKSVGESNSSQVEAMEGVSPLQVDGDGAILFLRVDGEILLGQSLGNEDRLHILQVIGAHHPPFISLQFQFCVTIKQQRHIDW